MNRIEYEHAVKKAKAARVWQNRDPNDPVGAEKLIADSFPYRYA